MNLFEPAAVQEIVFRLQNVNASTPAHWGKMNVAQMMAHCQVGFNMYFDGIMMKQNLMGKLFGKMAKKQAFSDKPWRRSLPTAPEFKIADQREFAKEKEGLLACVNRFAKEGNKGIIIMHPFFGKMTSEEYATLMYKHLDHHLKQFGA